MLPWERPKFLYARDIGGGASQQASSNTLGNPSGTVTTWTVSCWVNPDINNALQCILAKWGTSTTTRTCMIQITATGKLQCFIADTGGNEGVTGATTISTGAWHHLLLLKNGTGANALKCYLDGSQDASVTSNRSVVASNSANAAFRWGVQSGVGNSMDGKLAEVAIWEAVLTDAEILALAKGASPHVVRPNPRYYWPDWGVATPEIDFAALPSGETGTMNDGGAPLANHAPVMRPYASVGCG